MSEQSNLAAYSEPTMRRLYQSSEGDPRDHDGQQLDRESGVCENCGGRPSDDFVRVFAGNDGRVYHCPECANGDHIVGGAVSDPDYNIDDTAVVENSIVGPLMNRGMD